MRNFKFLMGLISINTFVGFLIASKIEIEATERYNIAPPDNDIYILFAIISFLAIWLIYWSVQGIRKIWGT